jgi:Rrf2 family transcriptional regulator, cysteine metabolism repressor
MKFSAKGDYACLAMLELSLRHRRGEQRTSIEVIADSQNIPIKFLVQILLQLKGSGFLISHRGAKGGYSLAKPPHEIVVGEILRLVDGPLMDVKCLDGRAEGSCNGRSKCVLKSIWEEVEGSIANVVDNITFADLSSKYNNTELMFHI